MKIAREVALIVTILTVGATIAIMGWKTCRTLDVVNASVAATSKELNTQVLPQLADTAQNASYELTKIQVNIQMLQESTDRTLIVAGAAITNVEKATRSLKAQEDAQAAYWAQTSANVDAVSKNANALVENANKSIDQLNASLGVLPMVMANASRDLAELEPVLKKSDTVMANTATTTGQLALVAQDTREMVDHLKDNILKPVKKTTAAAKAVAGWSATVLGKALSPW